MRTYKLKLKHKGYILLCANNIKTEKGFLCFYQNYKEILKTDLDLEIEDVTDIYETYTTAQEKTHVVKVVEPKEKEIKYIYIPKV